MSFPLQRERELKERYCVGQVFLPFDGQGPGTPATSSKEILQRRDGSYLYPISRLWKRVGSREGGGSVWL